MKKFETHPGCGPRDLCKCGHHAVLHPQYKYGKRPCTATDALRPPWDRCKCKKYVLDEASR